jgi:hypothetical protein
MPRAQVYFGESTFRRRRRPVGMCAADRLSHTYVIGKTGVGKSTLIETLAYQDAIAGRGFALVDPHGDLVERLYAALPDDALARTTYFNAPDDAQPYGYNPLRQVRQDKIPLAVSGLLETLHKLWPDAWGMRMEHVLRNCLYALLEQPRASLTDILALLMHDPFRKSLARMLENEIVRDFWQVEYAKYPARLRAEAIAPIQNKLGALLSDPRLRRILVEPTEPIRFRSTMDEGGILLVNLAKGRIGEDTAHVLGGLIVSTLGLAAFSRAETAERRPFIVYLDEFQSFTTLSLINMMSELRKYGVGLVLAHQHLNQLDPDIRHAVLGNAGTLVSFRVGPADAIVLAAEFQPVFDIQDLLNLPNHRIYVKLMINGTPSRPFSAATVRLEDLPRVGRPQVKGMPAPLQPWSEDA